MNEKRLNEEHAQTVREIADELHGQLDAFADAVAAGDVDEQMTTDVIQNIAELYPAVADAAVTVGCDRRYRG